MKSLGSTWEWHLEIEVQTPPKSNSFFQNLHHLLETPQFSTPTFRSIRVVKEPANISFKKEFNCNLAQQQQTPWNLLVANHLWTDLTMEVSQREQIMVLPRLIQSSMKLSAEFRSLKCRGNSSQIILQHRNLQVLSALSEEISQLAVLWMNNQALEPTTPNNRRRLLTRAILHQTTLDCPYPRLPAKLTPVKLEFLLFRGQTT